jgi:hypothetical protein
MAVMGAPPLVAAYASSQRPCHAKVTKKTTFLALSVRDEGTQAQRLPQILPRSGRDKNGRVASNWSHDFDEFKAGR